MRNVLAISMALLALAACREEEKGAAAGPEPEGRQEAAARQAAETAVRERLRSPSARLRGVQVFSQALPNTMAVCGRSSTTGTSSDPFMPYVAVVSFEGDTPRVSNLVLGANGPEATRVFIEMVDRCFEGGGPMTTRVMARSYPPLPDPRAQASAQDRYEAGPREDPQLRSLPPAPNTVPEPIRSTQTVTVSSRAPANLRSSMRGEVIGTLPRSARLEVFGEGPGGWYQVGEGGSPMGWVHASVLEGAPRRSTTTTTSMLDPARD